ncbi:MAG: glycosyltransferase [Bacteroidales bacterium]|nr:glycosyltransferase [Bacteroidales bacterium]
MIRLSVLIITYNEERNIQACLESVKNLADEIIVLDSFSTDKTEEICAKYGTVFVQHKFEGYIEQKNRALKEAKYEYVLSIDADERISKKLEQEILSQKESPKYDAYKFNRLSYYNGRWIKHSGWYPDTKLRLWRKEIGNWAGRNPHDEVKVGKRINIKHLSGDILHYSFYSLEEHLAQTNKFSTIAAQMLFDEKKKIGSLKLYFSPFIKFFRDYLKNLGFLDGWEGLTICRINALGTYLKYAKLRELYRKEKLNKLNK